MGSAGTRARSTVRAQGAALRSVARVQLLSAVLKNSVARPEQPEAASVVRSTGLESAKASIRSRLGVVTRSLVRFVRLATRVAKMSAERLVIRPVDDGGLLMMAAC